MEKVWTFMIIDGKHAIPWDSAYFNNANDPLGNHYLLNINTYWYCYYHPSVVSYKMHSFPHICLSLFFPAKIRLVQWANMVSLFSLWKVIAPRDALLTLQHQVSWERGPSLRSSQRVASTVMLPLKSHVHFTNRESLLIRISISHK